jgi:hypothetical protein
MGSAKPNLGCFRRFVVGALMGALGAVKPAFAAPQLVIEESTDLSADFSKSTAKMPAVGPRDPKSRAAQRRRRLLVTPPQMQKLPRVVAPPEKSLPPSFPTILRNQGPKSSLTPDFPARTTGNVNQMAPDPFDLGQFREGEQDFSTSTPMPVPNATNAPNAPNARFFGKAGKWAPVPQSPEDALGEGEVDFSDPVEMNVGGANQSRRTCKDFLAGAYPAVRDPDMNLIATEIISACYQFVALKNMVKTLNQSAPQARASLYAMKKKLVRLGTYEIPILLGVFAELEEMMPQWREELNTLKQEYMGQGSGLSPSSTGSGF